MADNSRPKPRKRKRLLRIVVMLLIVLAVGAAAGWFAFPHIVKWRLHATLVQAGFTEVAFDVERVSLSSITLTDVRLGEDHRFIAPRVTADYVVGEVLAGRVRNLTVYDGNWMAVVTDDGELDISPWDEIGGDDTASDGGLPFAELVLVRGNMEVRRGGGAVNVPVDGRFVDLNAGRVGLSLRGRYEQVLATVEGEVTTDDLTADLTVALSIAGDESTSKQSPDADVTVRVTYAGDAGRPIAIEIDGSGASLDLSRVPQGAEVRLGEYAINGSLSIDTTGLVHALDLNMRAESVEFGEAKVARVAVDAERDEQSVLLYVSGLYDTWEVAQLYVRAPADVRAWLSMETWFATAFEIKGALPAELNATLSESGIAAPGLQSLVLSGEAELRLGANESADGAVQNGGIKIEMRSGEIDLPVGDVQFVDEAGETSAAFEGVRLALPFEGRISSDGVRIALKAASVATIGDVQVAGMSVERADDADDKGSGAINIAIADAEAGLLPDARPLAGAGVLAVSFNPEDATQWELTLPRMVVAGRPMNIAGASWRAAGVALEAEVYLHASPGSTRAVGGATIAFESAAYGDADAALATAGPSGISVTGEVATLANDTWSAEGSVKLTQPTTLAGEAWSSSLGGFSADVSRAAGAVDAAFTMQMSDLVSGNWKGPQVGITGSAQQEGESLRAQLRLRADELRNDELEVVTSPITIDAQVERANAESDFVAELSGRAERFRYQGNELPDLSLTGAWRDERLVASGAWPITQAAEMNLQGVVDFSGDDWKANATATLPRAELAADDPLTLLITSMLEVNVTGALAAEFVAKVDPQTSGVTGKVELAGVSISGSSGEGDELMKWQVDQLVGDVALAGVDPMQTAPQQTLKWSAAKFGEVQLAAGTARYTLQSPQQLRISQLRLTMPDGGVVSLVAPVQLDPAAPDVTASLALETFSLDSWVELATLGYVTGQGRVSGRLKLRVATSDGLKIALGEGSVSAAPGGNFQVVDFKGAGEVVGEDVKKTLAELDISQEIQERIKEALSDFQFEALSFNMIRENDDTTLQIHTSGKGRRGTRQEIGGLTVNIHNYNELFDVAMRTKLGLEKATAGIMNKLAKPADKGERK